MQVQPQICVKKDAFTFTYPCEKKSFSVGINAVPHPSDWSGVG